MKHHTSGKKRSNNLPAFFAMIIATIIFIVVVIRILFLLIPGKILLDDFISLEFSGYNTVGKAHITFDYNLFIDQYGEKIKFKSEEAKEEFIQYYPDSAELSPAACWLMLVKVGLNQYDSLSNGDLITLKSNSADSAVTKYFNYIAVYDDAEYIVEGLEELTEINLFADMTLSFAGYSPTITVFTAELSSKWAALENLSIDISKTAHLAEGENIDISLQTMDGTDINEYLATYGYAPATISQSFEASGAGHYITSSNEIAADILEQLKLQSETIYTNYLQTKNGSDYQWTHDVNQINYIGSILLTSKDTASTDTTNTLYLVHELNTYITAKPSSKRRTTYKNNVVWYFVTQYDNIALDRDGTCNITPSVLSLVQSGEVRYDADDTMDISQLYYGYASIDDIHTLLINPQTTTYDCEINLNFNVE